MKKDEILSVLRIVRMSYPNFYKDMTKEQAKDMIDVWGMMLADDDAKIVIEAVKAVVVTSKFPPSIADIKSQIKIITKTSKHDTEEEAWFKVSKSLSNSYYNSQKEFDKLDDISKRLVGNASTLREYGQMDTEKLNTVIKSNFMRSYRNLIQERKDFENLPSSAKQLSQAIGSKNKLLGE